jgi:hypothetical protein
LNFTGGASCPYYQRILVDFFGNCFLAFNLKNRISMKLLFCAVFLLSACFVNGQARPVCVMDFVKVINNNRAETIHYYENNWKRYREIALQKKIITGYSFLSVLADSAANFDLVLITEYADSSQYNLAEERFTEIIKTVNPDGPVLLNEKKPADFRQILFNKKAARLFPTLKD